MNNNLKIKKRGRGAEPPAGFGAEPHERKAACRAEKHAAGAGVGGGSPHNFTKTTTTTFTFISQYNHKHLRRPDFINRILIIRIFVVRILTSPDIDQSGFLSRPDLCRVPDMFIKKSSDGH